MTASSASIAIGTAGTVLSHSISIGPTHITASFSKFGQGTGGINEESQNKIL